MLFRRLEIDSVGPFAGHHVIDLDSLTAGGLFLLEGPTGSGKSSLIDAIVFALYGETAGAESDYSRIRSTYADPATPSRVELVFTVGAGTFKVTRTPRWNKPKRGGGTTPVSEKATLIRLSEAAVEQELWDSGEVLATKSSDVGMELGSILSLSRAQFVQTVVLPQGQFADFLRLKSEDRSQLLETLFNTRLYRDFATRLHRKMSDASQGVAEKRTAITHAVSGWLGNSAVSELKDEFLELDSQLTEPDDSRLVDRVESCLSELHERHGVLSQQLAESASVLQKAQAWREEQHALADNLKRRSQLLLQKTECEAQAEDIDVVRQRVARHHQAVIPAERYSVLLNHEKRLKKREEVTRSAFRALPESNFPTLGGLDPATCDITQTLTELHQAEEQLRESLTYLRMMREREETTVIQEHELHKRQEELAESLKKLETIQERQDRIPEELVKQEAQQATAEKHAQQLPAIDSEISTLTEKLARTTEHDALREHIHHAEISHAELVEANTNAHAHFVLINSRWIASQAAILSAELEENQPCPVCGSAAHPAPAQPTDEHASKSDVEQAQEELNRVRAQLEQSSSNISALRARSAALLDQLGELTYESITSSLNALQAQKDEAQAARSSLEKLRSTISALRHEKEEAGSRYARLEAECQGLRERITEEEHAIATAREEVAKAQGDASSISALISATEENSATIARCSDALKAYEAAQADVIQAQATLSVALKDASLNLEEVRAATLKPSEAESLTASIQNFESAWARIHGQLESPELSALTGEETAHVDEADTAAKVAQETHSDLASQEAIMKEGIKVATASGKLISTAVTDWAHELQTIGPLVRLDQLAQAGKASRTNVSLQVWVLMRRFDMVIDRANAYLSRFSHGRYELIRSEARENERRTGLGLSIIDYDARGEGESEIRSTRSLSGGETFYTALSLALGLTEVVQEENGGIRIDTLMIDEGFGTLSSEILDDVMSTLSELAKEGRKVGIISHVDELKSRVPNQVRITPSKGKGSTLSVIS